MSRSRWGQSAFNSPPPADDEETTDPPVGVKSGHSAKVSAADPDDEGMERERANWGRERGMSPSTRDQPATFYESDVDRPGTQSPERIAQLQAQLVQAGLLKKGSFRLGVWDAATRAAYREVLVHANRTGRTSAEDSLGAFLAAPATDDDEEKPKPFRASLPNLDDLRKDVDELATATIGRGVEPEERERFVAMYSALIERQQRKAYDTAETGGSVTEAPRFDTFVEGQLERIAPDEVKAKKMANLSKLFLAGIQSGGVDRTF